MKGSRLFLGEARLACFFAVPAFTARQARFAPEKRRRAAALHTILRNAAILPRYSRDRCHFHAVIVIRLREY
jgi:hypothetical protein